MILLGSYRLFIFSEVGDQHLPWAKKLSDNLEQRWLNFLRCLPEKVHLARSIPGYREPLEEVELHTFGGASGSGISAVVYVVVKQPSGVRFGLVAQNRDWPRIILQSQGWNWYIS
jgi:hypothetical protein